MVHAHERYAYRFAHQQFTLEKRTLKWGDYAVEVDGVVVAAVERKSLTDLLSSMTGGRLRFALAELAALPRAAVVVEDRYSQVFTNEHVRAAVAADGLAELQVRYPGVPIVFCETRSLAEERTYRYLAAAASWSADDEAALDRIEAVELAPVSGPRLPTEQSPRGSTSRRRERSGCGPWSPGSRCLTGAGCVPTSSRGGAGAPAIALTCHRSWRGTDQRAGAAAAREPLPRAGESWEHVRGQRSRRGGRPAGATYGEAEQS